MSDKAIQRLGFEPVLPAFLPPGAGEARWKLLDLGDPTEIEILYEGDSKANSGFRLRLTESSGPLSLAGADLAAIAYELDVVDDHVLVGREGFLGLAQVEAVSTRRSPYIRLEAGWLNKGELASAPVTDKMRAEFIEVMASILRNR